MSSLVEKLKRNNIRQVYCIDDDNASPNPTNANDLVLLFLDTNNRKAKKLAESDQRFTALYEERCGFDGNCSREERRAALEPLALDLFESGEIDQAALKSAASILCPDPKGLIQEKLQPLFRLEGVDFQALSFSKWDALSSDILKQAKTDARVLLLVDETNDKETEVAHLNGTSVLAGIFTDNNADVNAIDCIVVTANCEPKDEMDASYRTYLAVRELTRQQAQEAKKVRKVFVLSKDRLSQVDLETEFAIHLDRLEAARLGDELTTVAHETLVSAVTDSADWLKEIPLPEFHSSIFVSSRNEGAAEIDTLIRLVSIRQRVALESRLKGDPRLRVLIERMRALAASSFDIETASKDRLKELRLEEFERQGDLINTLMAPLACGDVFKIALQDKDDNVTEVEAMLLANPCDLVLRQKGIRKLNTGLLVQIFRGTREEITKKLSENSNHASLYYALHSGADINAISYLFLNSKVEAVPLSVLDLCWTNRTGEANFNGNTLDEAHSTPQQFRLRHLKSRVDKAEYTNIELWGSKLLAIPGEVPSNDGDDKVRTLKYALNRKWRLAPEFASAALSALAQSLARPAFGHDYTH